jgi:hypothetical protein
MLRGSMSKRFHVIWLLSLALVSVPVAACSSSATSEKPGPLLSKTVDGLQTSVVLTPSPLQASKETAVKITLSDDKGQLINDARIVVVLTATAMAMSPVRALPENKGNGVYTAVLSPTGHSGKHTLAVDVQWQGRGYRAEFDNLEVK